MHLDFAIAIDDGVAPVHAFMLPLKALQIGLPFEQEHAANPMRFVEVALLCNRKARIEVARGVVMIAVLWGEQNLATLGAAQKRLRDVSLTESALHGN